VEAAPPFQQRFVRFLIGLVRNTRINRADIGALFGGKRTNALGAPDRVNDVNSFSLGDGVVGAFRFAGAATDAFLGNFESHFSFLTSRQIGNTYYS
jgi:hypothetical protein